MADPILFVPTQPSRVADWPPAWRFFYGERLRSSVWGLPEPVFIIPQMRYRFLHMWSHIVNDPDMIGHILLENRANYVRPELARKMVRPVLGNGLFNAEGEDWRTQRHLVAASFTPAAVDRMAGLMADAAREQIAGWPRAKTQIDMAEQATSATMVVIARALFSGDGRLMSSEAEQHISRIFVELVQPRLSRLIGLEHLDPSPSLVRLRRSQHYLRKTLADMVRERGPDGGSDDFFGGLMRALHAAYPADEANGLAIDNAATFYGAGFETTAVTLAWSIYLLAAQPNLQEELRAEAVTALSGDAASLAARLPLLRQFLDESMRLYPPLLQIVRQALDDDEMCGTPVKKGDILMIYPWIVHRHRKLWDDPDAFDITRFSPERKAKQHRFQHIPFGAGQRICVGARFAIVEALTILAHWLGARRFSLPQGAPPPMPYGTITLRPKHGMPLIVKPV